MRPIPPEYEADIYAYAGPEYEQAWDILHDGCRVPPSLEQFEHVWSQMSRQTPGITAERVARVLVNTYRPIRT